MRSLLALASILHAEPARVLDALAGVLASEGYERVDGGLERRLPLVGIEQWRVLPDEEGARVECELVSLPGSPLAGVLARRRIRAAPERFRAVVTRIAGAVEPR